MFVATIVGTHMLGEAELAGVRAALNREACAPGEIRWIEEGKAADIPFGANLAAARAILADLAPDMDGIAQEEASRRKALLVADMDSTMITVECIDELADYAGIKREVAEITERAMRGELDFEAALRGRVALLKGLDDDMIDQCRAERVRIMPGARALVRTMRAHGAQTLLVSGGFTRFAEPVAAEIGFHRAVANVLTIADGKLDGTVTDPVVDAGTKERELEKAISDFAIDRALTLAIGDGANDIPMIRKAGLGVAYHAKPKTRAAASAQIVHGDLSVLLYAQGYARADWVED